MVSNITKLLLCWVIVVLLCNYFTNCIQHFHHYERSHDEDNQYTMYYMKSNILKVIKSYDLNHIQIQNRSLAIIHVGLGSIEDSMDLLINNIKLLSSSIISHIENKNNMLTNNIHNVYYIINIVEPHNNVLTRYLPSIEHYGNDLSVVYWYRSYGDFMTHQTTVNFLTRNIIKKVLLYQLHSYIYS